jgi:hypothetical protein
MMLAVVRVLVLSFCFHTTLRLQKAAWVVTKFGNKISKKTVGILTKHPNYYHRPCVDGTLFFQGGLSPHTPIAHPPTCIA